MSKRGWAVSISLMVVVCSWNWALAQSTPFDLHMALTAAQPDSTIVVPAGRYTGTFVIDKPLTLIGSDHPILQGDGSGDVVRIQAKGVSLRGFIIRGSGNSLDREDAAVRVNASNSLIEENQVEDALFGIYLANAANSVVRNNLILGKDLPISRRGDSLKVWYSANTLIEGNTIRDGRDTVIWFSPNTITRHNVFENNRYGLHFMSTNNQVIEQNIIRHNSVGIYLMYGTNFQLRQNLLLDNHGPSGYGIGLKEVNDVTLEGNRIVSNRVGIYIDKSPLLPGSKVNVVTNLFAYNEVGVQLLPDVHHNEYTRNIFLENNEQIAISGGGELSENDWAANGEGNYWSDYAGFDSNHDQIGELPYQATSLFEDLMEEYPELRIFQLSPATAALDLAAKAFPIFQPRAKMSDPHPLTVPPTLPKVPGIPEPPRFENLLAAGGLLCIGLVVLLGVNLKKRTKRFVIRNSQLAIGH
ncbi:MAG: nitrous oxide reductase family maturation protein NosD [Caldilineaceae bacterium]